MLPVETVSPLLKRAFMVIKLRPVHDGIIRVNCCIHIRHSCMKLSSNTFWTKQRRKGVQNVSKDITSLFSNKTMLDHVSQEKSRKLESLGRMGCLYIHQILLLQFTTYFAPCRLSFLNRVSVLMQKWNNWIDDLVTSKRPDFFQCTICLLPHRGINVEASDYKIV